MIHQKRLIITYSVVQRPPGPLDIGMSVSLYEFFIVSVNGIGGIIHIL